MKLFNPFKRRIYLDYASATPIDPKVTQVMSHFASDNFANPSSIHKEGVIAREKIEQARQKIATVLGIRPSGVIFTASGTESNNLAILGHFKYLVEKRSCKYSDLEMVTTKIEHPSISTLLPILEELGVTVRYVEVDELGRITPTALTTALTDKTNLVTFAYANSEIGVIQAVLRLSRVVREAEKRFGTKILLHLDAAQAPLWLPCKITSLGVDMITLDAGKCYGPKGVGILAFHNEISLLPIIHGGGQEQGLRPGTESTVGIVGSAEAISLAQADYQKRSISVAKIRDQAILIFKKELPEMVLNGPTGEERLANNINLSLPGFDTEYAVVYLDLNGVSASTKSACAGSGSGESLVVQTISKDTTRSKSTIRFTLGTKTTLDDLKKTTKILKRFCQKMTPYKK